MLRVLIFEASLASGEAATKVAVPLDLFESVKETVPAHDTDVYADGGKNVHEFYILDGEDLGCSWMKLKSGKYANLDNLWMEYKSIVNDK